MNIVLEEQLASCVLLFLRRLFAIKPWKINAEQVSMAGQLKLIFHWYFNKKPLTQRLVMRSLAAKKLRQTRQLNLGYSLSRSWYGTREKFGNLEESREHFCRMRLNLIYAQRLQIVCCAEWAVLRMRNKSRQDLFRHSCKLFCPKSGSLEKRFPEVVTECGASEQRSEWWAQLELNCVLFFSQTHLAKVFLVAAIARWISKSFKLKRFAVSSCFRLRSFVLRNCVAVVAIRNTRKSNKCYYKD